jgi:adenylosuccinate lyase
MPLWHERDISHSSAERVILPDSFILTDFMLTEAIDILKNWRVLPKNMLRNIQANRGLVFSQMVLLALTNKGMVRNDAYELVQRNSLKAWNEGLDFKGLVLADADILKRLTPAEIEACFDIRPYLLKIDYIFERVLGK